jgi:hypothetical protein
MFYINFKCKNVENEMVFICMFDTNIYVFFFAACMLEAVLDFSLIFMLNSKKFIKTKLLQSI